MVAIWAPEASKQYDVVSFVGSGCFSSVWVAKPKERKPCPLHPNDEASSSCGCDHVAMKSTVIAQRDDPERAYKYAKQEVQVLLQLDHPHIVKVVQQFAFETSVYSVALKFAPGPTVEHLVDYRGALGVPFAQCIAKQLISALAYMHSRGVIHRDLKPDNVIVTGASFSEDAVWCDEQENPQVQELLHKCHITVVDYGFAKVLTPQDVRKTPITAKDPSKKVTSKKISLNNALNEKRPKRRNDIGVAVDSSTSDTSNTSISKHQCLDLTALGNKHYCAPEVLQTLRALSQGVNPPPPNDDNVEQKPIQPPKQQEISTTKNVANYGMNADSFSLGALLRYLLTGVPPEYKIEEYISRQQNFVALIANYLFLCCPKKNNNNNNLAGENVKKRTPRLKRSYEIPKDASNLIQSLTKRNAQDRETVRNVQCHPWIQLKEINDPTVHEPLRFLVLDP